MRLTTFAATAVALVLCACSNAETATAEGPTAEAAAATPAAATEHDMAAMKSADVADDAATGLTPDGYTFHTIPAKVESVHLPAGAWTATASDPALVTVGAASDLPMPNGEVHHVVQVTPKASGNASVKFERAAAAGAAAETRTIQFMVH